MKKILLTTGLTYDPSLEVDYCYLGEWCIPDNKKYLACSIQEYHWNDREKFRKDYLYLDKLIDHVLLGLVKTLNQFHQVNYNSRYWRIILGPWLIMYLPAIFDRWENLRIFFKENKADETSLCTLDDVDLIPSDFDYFRLELAQSEVWNHYIYKRILLDQYKKNINFKQDLFCAKTPNRKVIKKKINILNYADKLFSLIQKKYKVILVQSAFNLKDFLRLCLELRQLPRIHNEFFHNFYFSNKSINRSKLQFKLNSNNEFESFLEKFILTDIPITYVEGYDDLKIYSNNITSEAPIIFTTTEHLHNDLFNHWCAFKTLGKTKLFVSQHGGSIKSEMSIFSHQEKISDKMVVWHKVFDKKHIRLSPTKMIGLDLFKLNGVEISLIALEGRRFTYGAQSGPKGSGGLIKDYQQKIDFIQKLKPEILQKLRVRAMDHGLGWFGAKKRYTADLGEQYISKHESLYETYKHSKIIVCAYPQTTFMEAMLSGIPTILIYPDDLWEFLPIFDELIETLKENNVIFTNPDRAAKHINLIYSNPYEWWSSEALINARQLFFETCGQVDDDWLDKWTMVFLDS